MNPEELSNLLRAPSEALAVEFKSWLDLSVEANRSKVARALIALRNNNGGMLVIGFDDKTLKPAKHGRPADLAAAYHPDEVQRIVKDYATVPFEVKLELAEREGKTFPVLCVGAGVVTPALTRRTGDKLRQNAVYVRSVQNNVVESTEPRTPEDWDRLFRICFDNREADIARFFQRNLSGIAREIRRLPEAGSPLTALFDEAAGHFAAALDNRQKSEAILPSAPIGWHQVGAVLLGEPKPVKLAALLDQLFPRQPRLSGWPIWIDSRPLHPANRPHTDRGGWDALVALERPDLFATPLVDFWRLEPQRLYHQRIHEDDLRTTLGKDRGTVLDYVIAIKRTTEALVVAHAFARTLAVEPDRASLLIRFRWTRLRDRRFLSWSNPGRDLWTATTAFQDEASAEFEVPLATARASLVPFVVRAVEPLFEAFGSDLAVSLGAEIATAMLRPS